jgi:hypothetical protein
MEIKRFYLFLEAKGRSLFAIALSPVITASRLAVPPSITQSGVCLTQNLFAIFSGALGFVFPSFNSYFSRPSSRILIIFRQLQCSVVSISY